MAKGCLWGNRGFCRMTWMLPDPSQDKNVISTQESECTHLAEQK